MDHALQPGLCVPALVAAFILIWAQSGPPGPPKPPEPDPAEHVADVHRKIDSMKPVNVTAQRALAYSRGFLASADRELQSGDLFRAGRFAEASDSLLHVAEHQEHLHARDSAQGPPTPPPDAVQDHLQQVYFRTRQAEYFFKESRDPRVASFPRWARDFYQLAIRDLEQKDVFAADENAKSSDDVVRALENLAQAAISRDRKQP